MKVEIDLNEILGDEYGAETLQESIRRQVIDNVSAVVKTGIAKKVEEEVSSLINDEVRKSVADKLPSIVDDLLSTKYTPLDSYGRAGKETDMRTALIDELTKQLVYKPTNSSYDRNYFTKSVDEVVASSINEFKASYQKTIDENISKEMLAHAVSVLKTKLGL